MKEKYDFTVPTLGKASIPSPIELSTVRGDSTANYVSDDEKVLNKIRIFNAKDTVPTEGNELELAGPRENIFFNPSHVHVAVVTCGGLCPGLNNVIRAIVRCLWYSYDVRRITGIQNGYRGFLADDNFPTIEMTPALVDDIQMKGGTILGSSRGGGKQVEEIADALERMNINVLFTIGGDGTQRGAVDIAEELEKRKLKIAIVGVPKTIDNDLNFIQRSFGFETAVAKAVEAVMGAHVEAHDAINGIGLVKVMGRDSGFIAAHTSLAMNDVDFCLIPENPFDLEGENGFFAYLKKRIINRKHAVVLVAEGAGQELVKKVQGTDRSGNKKLSDIGLFLKEEMNKYFTNEGIEVNIKYIDPSYIIRSSPANPNDSIYCSRLGAHAVHAAMAGKTKILIGLVNNNFVHLPIKIAVTSRKYVDQESSLWRDVLENTRQPVHMSNEQVK